MAKSKKIQKAKHKIVIKRRGGIPNWLYMTLSFVIPIYGLLYYFLLKDKDHSRAKIALFFTTLGFMVWILLKVIVWLR